MQMKVLLVTALCLCMGPPTLAQIQPSASDLVQQLQSEKTTDAARNELVKRGKSDPDVRRYLATHLPQVIETGPTDGNCFSDGSCRAWENAVEIAMRLKMAEAAPALARWIAVKEINPWPGIRAYGNKLTYNPAAIALSAIGDPAIPALRHALDYGDTEQHALAVRSLCTIGTPKAKAVLRDDLQNEPDPDLRATIKEVLQKKNTQKQ